ncbi:hypothetical protein BMT55_01005 [Listeria newyorkensis]|uniref:Uncharacterized protein n=1 Tax=Listeria newyorkensis TaxID=1497681 RepID=A0ABX4XXS9_9LIST|nr:hypothetical protein [Listeria newyorkensis]KGL43909.1 hypothetical protein EP58_05495 [Listeria newyorkensis]PNP94959.1 hypothetical protein BMT55_01005 [Listeria newyorkensis]WAO21888.1 hypothetical protein OTR81_00900 [Listeria newyorkensis]SQC59781.1 Uncharacterised protein [Listeria newyorkensis]
MELYKILISLIALLIAFLAGFFSDYWQRMASTKNARAILLKTISYLVLHYKFLQHKATTNASIENITLTMNSIKKAISILDEIDINKLDKDFFFTYHMIRTTINDMLFITEDELAKAIKQNKLAGKKYEHYKVVEQQLFVIPKSNSGFIGCTREIWGTLEEMYNRLGYAKTYKPDEFYNGIGMKVEEVVEEISEYSFDKKYM